MPLLPLDRHPLNPHLRTASLGFAAEAQHDAPITVTEGRVVYTYAFATDTGGARCDGLPTDAPSCTSPPADSFASD